MKIQKYTIMTIWKYENIQMLKYTNINVEKYKCEKCKGIYKENKYKHKKLQSSI